MNLSSLLETVYWIEENPNHRVRGLGRGQLNFYKDYLNHKLGLELTKDPGIEEQFLPLPDVSFPPDQTVGRDDFRNFSKKHNGDGALGTNYWNILIDAGLPDSYKYVGSPLKISVGTREDGEYEINANSLSETLHWLINEWKNTRHVNYMGPGMAGFLKAFLEWESQQRVQKDAHQ